MDKQISDWPKSLWNATASPLDYLPAIPGQIETDLLIIGAGYTGLSCALHSTGKIKDIVVIDRVQPGWGCSGRNGGQINPQWKPSLNQLRTMYPGPSFGNFIDILNQSANLVFELIDRYSIQCEKFNEGCMLAGRGNKATQYLTEWGRFWLDYGARVEVLDAKATLKKTGTNAYDISMLDKRGGSLQPLSYARGLAQACLREGVQIFGDTQAVSVQKEASGWKLLTPHGDIKCKRLVIGTNGYTDELWPGLSQSIVPVASMITATDPLPDEIADQILPGRYPVAEYAGVPAYFRIDESKRMVFGWRGNLAGAIGNLNTAHLRAKAIKLFPQLESVGWSYDWAGYVGITSHQRPQLIHLGENALAGLGYNGRGITMATMMGKQLALTLDAQSPDLPIEKLQRIPFHAFYPLGVGARIVSGHLRDLLTSRNQQQ